MFIVEYLIVSRYGKKSYNGVGDEFINDEIGNIIVTKGTPSTNFKPHDDSFGDLTMCAETPKGTLLFTQIS